MGFSSDGTGMYMPIQPADGFGSGGGFGDGAWLWVLLLFAMFGNGGWGNGFGGFAGMEGLPYFYNTQTQNDVNRGFDQAATAGTLAGIQSSINAGFSNAEISACNRAMTQMQTDYTNQIASMNQNFANQQALAGQLNGIQSQMAACCCENRAGVADLKYTVATEACADRAAISSALRDVIEANTSSTQRILDQMCQDKIDAKNEKINELQNQLSMAQLAASQNAQTAALIANNEAQTTALEQYLAPVPRPAYIVQNPACACNQNFGCVA